MHLAVAVLAVYLATFDPAHSLQCYHCGGFQLDDRECLKTITCGDDSYCGIVAYKIGFDGVKRVAGCYQRGAFPEYEVMLMNMCIGTEPYKTCVCNTDNCNDGGLLALNRAIRMTSSLWILPLLPIVVRYGTRDL